jgi:hypothetical protein
MEPRWRLISPLTEPARRPSRRRRRRRPGAGLRVRRAPRDCKGCRVSPERRAPWGRVTVGGTLADGAHVTGITHIASSGIYCIALDPSVAPPVVLVASPNFNGDTTSAGDDIQAVIEFDSSTCAGGELRADTFEMNNGDLTVKDQAFSFVVP